MAPISHVFFNNVEAVNLKMGWYIFEVWCEETHLVGVLQPKFENILVKLDRSSPQVGMNI